MLQNSVMAKIALSLVTLIFVSETFAQQNIHGPGDDQHQNSGCHQDKDCGEKAKCDRGSCSCPEPRKIYTLIADGKPMCQKIAEIEESCNYDQQCEARNRYSRCSKGKCECYDTAYEGKNQMRHYQSDCYIATKVGNPCDSTEQCMASIKPENDVACSFNSTANRRACHCNEGGTCYEKDFNGDTKNVGRSNNYVSNSIGATSQVAGLVSFGITFVVFMATKVVL